MSDVHLIALTVNGTRHEVAVEARRTLADVLRHDLGYTGTHLGCEHGICGACTVLIDGEPTRSCLVFGVQADDSDIETVEGLADPDGALNPLQDAFGEHHALQCGFCTPGFLMLATALLRENPDPTDDEIREAMASNICRCTGYQSILEAVRAAADRGGAPAAAGNGDRAAAAADETAAR
jgi:aerobic-type carbon monoxide dehydrogenase small subunit (CoxS/CutS family)